MEADVKLPLSPSPTPLSHRFLSPGRKSECRASASNADFALALYLQFQPAVTLLDIHMPQGMGSSVCGDSEPSIRVRVC